MKNIINKIFFIISKKYFLELTFILILTLLMTTFEIFSIALFIPLLTGFIGNTNESFILNYFSILRVYNADQVLIFTISLFLIVFVLKNVLLVFFNAIKSKFSYKLFIDISNKILKIYLNKNYSFFTNKNSSELIRNVNAEASIFTFGVVSVFIGLISDLIVVFSICIFLLFYNFNVSIFIILFIFTLSFLLLKITNKKFKNWGAIRHKY